MDVREHILVVVKGAARFRQLQAKATSREITMSNIDQPVHAKIVESPHHHLWTDALHARTLSHQAKNKWDKGTYVRWAVTTSWTVLVIACQDALNDKDIFYRFRVNVDGAILMGAFPPLDWGSGVWQRVRKLQKQRRSYIHRFLAQNDLFQEAIIADDAIAVVREAVVAIYQHVKRPAPTWIHDDDDRGWDTGKQGGTAQTETHERADREEPGSIHIRFCHGEEESTAHVLPGGVDYMPYVEDLLKRASVQISKIEVYQADELIYEQDVGHQGT